MGMRRGKIITMLTDFGLKDPYVPIMKAVIKSIVPNVEIVDISHEVRKFNVQEASYILLVTYNYFPKETIHLVVVDPGVGSGREPILVKTKNYVFIGPNNGVLTPAILEDGIIEVRVLENEDLFLKPISSTFHGRDIFAPVAAHVARGVSLEIIGRRLDLGKIVKTDYYVKAERKGSKITGSIIYIDTFGNLITSIPSSMLDLEFGEYVKLKIRGKVVELPYHPTFSQVPKGEPLIYPGSLGRLEVGVNMGDASSLFKAEIGDRVELEVEGK